MTKESVLSVMLHLSETLVRSVFQLQLIDNDTLTERTFPLLETKPITLSPNQVPYSTGGEVQLECDLWIARILWIFYSSRGHRFLDKLYA